MSGLEWGWTGQQLTVKASYPETGLRCAVCAYFLLLFNVVVGFECEHYQRCLSLIAAIDPWLGDGGMWS